MPPPLQRPPPPYLRLPGLWLGVATKARAWLGPDHLLYVEQAWFAERYCRLYFRDIEAVVVQATPNRFWWAVAAVAVGLAGLALALPPLSPTAARAVGAVLAALAGVGSLANWFRGPTCAVTVRTRVSDVRLRCWHRRRVAEKGIGRLAQEIEAVQGVLAPSALEAGWPAEPMPSSPPPATPPPPAPPPPPPRAGTRALMAAASLVLLVEAAFAAMAVPARTPILIGLLGATTGVLLPLIVVLMVRRPGGAQSGAAGRWGTGLLIYWVARGALLYLALMTASAVVSARQSVVHPDALTWSATLAMDILLADHIAGAVVCAVVALVSASMGVIGLLQWRRGA